MGTTGVDKCMIEHLGVNIRENKNGLKLTVSNSATGKLEELWEKSDRVKPLEVCRQEIEDSVSERMGLLKELSFDEFNARLAEFISNHRFKAYENIQELEGTSGYYILVLDEYRQLYIGSSSDILQRIRNHWTKKTYLSRPFYDGNQMRIDVFKALDTTRVFAYKSKSLTMRRVDTLVKEIPDKFVINTILKY
ncbi:hypothetical protein [Latilactobacillus curvatus]